MKPDREEVLRMAREIGVNVSTPSAYDAEGVSISLLERFAAHFYEAGADAGRAEFAAGVKIQVPSVTLEQEFQWHYRKGYEAGTKAERERLQPFKPN